jgi:hypothetical protein
MNGYDLWLETWQRERDIWYAQIRRIAQKQKK